LFGEIKIIIKRYRHNSETETLSHSSNNFSEINKQRL